jgi:hypothetical protein
MYLLSNAFGIGDYVLSEGLGMELWVNVYSSYRTSTTSAIS